MTLLRRTFDSRPLEWFLITQNAIIGIFLVSPVQTYGNVRGMTIFASMMSEETLGGIYIALACFHLWSLWRNKCFTCALSISAAWWGFVGITTMLAQPYSSRPLEAISVAIAHILVVWRGVRRG